MKFFPFLFIFILIFSCDHSEENRIATNRFQERFDSMKKNSPDILFITYLDIIQKSGSDSPMKKLTPDLLLNQEIFLYSSASKRYGELIIDILFYKKILSKKNISFDKLGSYIKKIRSNPKDKLDKILLESFDLMVKYTDQQLHLESNRY